ncbi:MAG TPA: serine hydrolase [Bacteroidetes bacterium]|nr:serine hydrolase [Bacteroidota bacterium]
MLKKILIGLIALVAVVFILTTITGTNYIYKAALYNTANLNDYKIFENRTVEAGAPQPLPVSSDFNKIVPDDSLMKVLEKTKTVSLLVLKNDSIEYEKYWNGYSDSSYSNSFSMAKTIVGLLCAFARKDGKILSFDQAVGFYLPEFKTEDKSTITIGDLLTMSSGTDWDESYSSPFSTTTEAYYGTDLYKVATGVKGVLLPGVQWRYKSGDTELLGLVLEKATGKNLSEYASEKLWKPLGAEHPALWSLDKKDGREKAYCCFNSNARDFSRIGTLLLHKGNWKGNQLLDTSVIDLYTHPLSIRDENDDTANYYGYQLWRLPDRNGVFYLRGILGQYVIVIPQKNVVVVRLGETRGEPIRHSYEEVYGIVDWILKKF